MIDHVLRQNWSTLHSLDITPSLRWMFSTRLRIDSTQSVWRRIRFPAHARCADTIGYEQNASTKP